MSKKEPNIIDGRWATQKVHLGITQSGRTGLFTGFTMAMPVSSEQYRQFLADPKAAETFCNKLGFQFERSK